MFCIRYTGDSTVRDLRYQQRGGSLTTTRDHERLNCDFGLAFRTITPATQRNLSRLMLNLLRYIL